MIGAGPGDAELLTLRAVRLLGDCDVVLFDRLVSKDVLKFARADAELIFVGKHEGEQDCVQARIFDLIATHAGQGRIVGRLKGGDPLIFGRGAEEWELALQHGIEVELVPGVSSAVSVPGLAGIPLTYRGVSQGFAVITAHCREGIAEQWDRYVLVDTLVVLMGVKNRLTIAKSLIQAGPRSDQPVAFIESGTTDRERVIESTLQAVAEGQVEVASPAVFVIGEVVRLRAQLSATAPAEVPPASAVEAR